MFVKIDENQMPLVSPHRIKKYIYETIHVLCMSVHEFQPPYHHCHSSSNSGSGSGNSRSIIPETQLFRVTVLVRACWFLFGHSFSTLKMRYKYYTITVSAFLCMHVCVCVCECVMCMVPEVIRQQLGVIEYKIVAGDYIKQSHTYIFYYVVFIFILLLLLLLMLFFVVVVVVVVAWHFRNPIV